MRYLIGMVLAGLVLAAPGAGRTEVVEQAENGFVVRQSVEVPRSPSEVWAELLAPAKCLSILNTPSQGKLP